MLFSVVFFSLVTLFFLRKVAITIGLVDKPNARKRHQGSIPLVGGISTTVVLSGVLLINPSILFHSHVYIACIGVLALLGALDDKFDLSVTVRMGIQAALSLVMVFYADLSLSSLGNLLGFGTIELGLWGIGLTVIAVIAAINAFNMVDGIDGLLGGLSIITFFSIAILYMLQGHMEQASFCFVLIAALIPYLAMNLGLLGKNRKVFMGDAGSMVIGFTVIWLLLGLSQTPNHTVLKPVTALWIIAIPLMDMTAIMYRRVRRGVSPFKPDRDHLHHIFQRVGFSPRKTLLVITTLAALLALIGISGEVLKANESTMFYAFLIGFALYSTMIARAWRFTRLVKRIQGEKSVVCQNE